MKYLILLILAFFSTSPAQATKGLEIYRCDLANYSLPPYNASARGVILIPKKKGSTETLGLRLTIEDSGSPEAVAYFVRATDGKVLAHLQILVNGKVIRSKSFSEFELNQSLAEISVDISGDTKFDTFFECHKGEVKAE